MRTCCYKMMHIAFFFLISSVLPSVVQWHNLSDTSCSAGQTNPGITGDFTDQDIDIKGINALYGVTSINAQTRDVTLTISADSVLTGSGNLCSGAVPPAALLMLIVDNTTITVNVNNDLSFSGTANNSIPQNLTVIAQGTGAIVFNIADQKTVSFTAQNLQSGGTTFYLNLLSANQFSPLRVAFNKQSSTGTSSVVIGKKSAIFGVTSGEPNLKGIIQYDITGSDVNTSALTINNGGLFTTGLYVLNSSNENPSIIRPATSSALNGSSLSFDIVNTQTDNSGTNFQIVNNNSGCPEYIFDPFCQNATTLPSGGFYLGPNGILIIPDNTYVDYIATATNSCCAFSLPDECGVQRPYKRLRNGSAFIVDGTPDNSSTSTINFSSVKQGGALFFRSGVDSCGQVTAQGGYPFAIDPRKMTKAIGNIVFDIEGALDIVGRQTVFANPQQISGISLLSLVVQPTGCRLFPSPDNGNNPEVFPKRTFARNTDGSYVTYNKGAFLLNNKVQLIETSLVHTDNNHKVYQKNSLGQGLCSEPTYVGGDTYWLCPKPNLTKPSIYLFNSIIHVCTDMALQAIDLFVTNNAGRQNDNNAYGLDDNFSALLMYGNGFVIDKGYGRNVILGANALFDNNCVTSTDSSAQCNIMQTSAQNIPAMTSLIVATPSNDDCVTQNIVGNIDNQPSLHSIFLNNETNISIGTEFPAQAGFDLTTTNQFRLVGCISVDASGGRTLLPELSNITGQGGIFVDTQGQLIVDRFSAVNFGTMVTKSGNGAISIPPAYTHFDDTVGVAQWNIDLNDPSQRIIVAQNDHFPHFIFDWGSTTKSYCANSTSTGCFIPYTPLSSFFSFNYYCDNNALATCYNGCFVPYSYNQNVCAINAYPYENDANIADNGVPSPVITSNNITNLPVVRGTVDSFEIQRSRVCDRAHLTIDGGSINSLSFQAGNDVGNAALAFLLVDNDGVVGIGNQRTDADNQDRDLVLGGNGIILAANGNGTYVLNQDVIIDSVCALLPTADFGSNQPNILTIRSDESHSITIRSQGVLDLTQFNTPNKIVQFSGKLTIIAEPGCRILMGNNVSLSQDTTLYLRPVYTTAQMSGTVPSDLDQVRVKISGVGAFNLFDNASIVIPQYSLMGIEAWPTQFRYVPSTADTNVQFNLYDQTTFSIGNDTIAGGALQIGNTNNALSTPSTIACAINLNGEGTLFQLERNGLLAVGLGVINKQDTIPSNWSLGCINDTTFFSININNGTFAHDQIVSSNNPLASLWAINATVPSLSFCFNTIDSVILGGGNIVLQTCLSSSINPIVTTTVGPLNNGTYSAGIFAGKKLLQDARKLAQPVNGVNAPVFFNYIATADASSKAAVATKMANITSEKVTLPTLGYIVGTAIQRPDTINIRNNTGGFTSPERSLKIGAVNIVLNTTTSSLINAQEIDAAYV